MGLSGLLMAAYGMGVVFSLRTHREIFGGAEHAEAGEARVFVDSVQKAAEAFGVTPAFVGFIVVALVGGAAQMASAFSGAPFLRFQLDPFQGTFNVKYI